MAAQEWAPDRALFGISVAAELTGVTPQMLRIYETKGLLEPERTDGGTRRYSRLDIERVDRITTLLAAGLNLAGVEQVLSLEAENEQLRAELVSRDGASTGDRAHGRHGGPGAAGSDPASTR